MLAAWPQLADFPPSARAAVLDQLAARTRRRAGWYAPETRDLLLARLVLEETRLARLAPELAPKRAPALADLLASLGPDPLGPGAPREALEAAVRLGLLADGAPYRPPAPALRRALIPAVKLTTPGRRPGGSG